jgi:hypothetical protein
MKKKKYVDAKELYCEIIVSKALGRLTRSAWDMLMKMVNELIKKFHYTDESMKVDLKQEALIRIHKYWFNFNEEKSHNTFAYFTEIIKRAFAFGWKNIKGKGGEFQHISINGLYENGGNMNI